MAVKGIVRLTALAVATGTLVATGAGTATAAPVADTSRVAAAGDGYAIRITLNLPSVLAGALGTETITQTISMTNGEVSTVTTPLAKTTAVLGTGNIPVVSPLLAKTTTASLTGKAEDTSVSPVNIDQLGVKLRLLPLTSKVANPAKDGVLAHSSSGVATLRIGGLGAAGLDTVLAPVQDVLDTALGTVDTVAGTATGTVGSVITGALDELAKSAPATAPAQAAVDQVTATLENTLDGLIDTLGSLDAATDIVTMDTIFSDQQITRKGDTVTSTVSNTVKNLNVLNGLVKIEAITSEATAAAGGKPGTANADFRAPVLNVTVANGALTALLDEKGLNLGGTVGSALPAQLTGTVNTAINTVNGLLNSLAGVDVVLGKGTSSVSEDGTSAAASVAATTVTVDPPALHAGPAPLLAAGKKLLVVDLVRANASAGTQLITAAPAAPPVAAPPVTVNAPTSLPRTGGELGVAAVAAALMGVALIARRRRSVYAS